MRASTPIQTALLALCLLVLTSCGPVTRVIKDGNGWLQKTVERNFLEKNVESVRRCWVLENGFCKEDGVQPQPVVATADRARMRDNRSLA